MWQSCSVKANHILKQLFPALVIFGLMLGCGGDKDTEKPTGDDQNGGSSTSTQSGGKKAADLAKFLSGKRLYVEVDMSQMGGGEAASPEVQEAQPEDEGDPSPDSEGEGGTTEEDPSSIGPDQENGETPISTAASSFRKMEMALQFEKDGKFFPARKIAGKWVSLKDDLRYKVTGSLKVTVYEDGKEDGGLTFPAAQLKKGDKIKFGPADSQREASITKIEDASPLATRPQGGGSDGGGLNEPAPEPSEEGLPLPEAESVEEENG